ncbi:MAG TPA: hypothetical protein VFU23_03565 [Gemmatimonadales bacterium]|nr:hypothetical protein [Gemmatimonadales bacterium]
MARGRTRRGNRTARSEAHDTDAGRALRAREGGIAVVPQVLLGAVDGVGVVAGGLLQLTRNVLLTAVSGAADIGAEALNGTVSAARGVVSATSRMVGDLAGTARSTFAETVSLATHSPGRGSARMAVRRPPVIIASRLPAAVEPNASPLAAAPSRRPTRRGRAAARPARSNAAA